MTLLVAQISDAHLVARTLLGEDSLQLTELGYLLTIDSGDDVTLLQSSSLCSTILYNLSHVDTLHRAQIHILFLLFLSVHIVLHVSTLDTDHGSLHVTILLQVVNHLIHNSSRDSEAVTDVRTCLRIEHSVDTNEFATCVHECTTRITLIDGSISLDKALHAIGAQRTGFGRDDTSGHRIVQSEGITNGEHPFTHAYIVAVGNGDGRQILSVDLDECQVGSLVGTNDACRILFIVCQTDSQFVSAVHHVIVGHDVTISRDDNTRASSSTFRRLHLTLALLSVITLSTTEETSERIREEILEWIAILDGLNL